MIATSPPSIDRKVRLELPILHPAQREIYDSPAKRKYVCNGRRFGKSMLIAYTAVNRALSGQIALCCSATQAQADVVWEAACRMIAPLERHGLVKINLQSRTIRAVGFQGKDGIEGRITVRTARDPDTLRGQRAHWVAIDEAAYTPPAIWLEVGLPTLADFDGDAMLCSTPKRKNWFYDLFQSAQDANPNVARAFTYPSSANPHLSASALAELAEGMTKDNYRQEILAEFLASGGEMFRSVRDAIGDVKTQRQPGHRYAAGVDLGRKQDFTVVIVIDKTDNSVVFIDRFNGIDWADQTARVIRALSKWEPDQILVDETGAGDPVVQQLRIGGPSLHFRGFMFNATSKRRIVDGLVLAFDNNEIRIPNDPVLVRELEAYTYLESAAGNLRYSAPNGQHDDCVMALALAWEARRGSGVGVFLV